MVYDSDSTHLYSPDSDVDLFICSRGLHVDRHINIIQYEINALYAHMYTLGTKSRLNV